MAQTAFEDALEIRDRRDGRLVLSVSEALSARVGEGAVLRFSDPGTRVASGRAFGVLSSTRSACYLYAPFDLVVEERFVTSVVVRRV